MTGTLTIPAQLQADITRMDEAADELRRITEKTEFALSVVSQAIRTQEAIAKGRVLLQLKAEIPTSEWQGFLDREDVQLKKVTADMYMNAARAIEDAAPLYGEEMLMNFGAKTLSNIHKLPADVKLEILDEAEKTGTAPTQREIEEVSKKTETKLSRTAERLADAKERKQAAEAANDKTGKMNAQNEIERFEARILQLESELEREKSQKLEISDSLTEKEDDLHNATKKLEEAQAELAKALEESHNLRFDEDTARQQRVSRVGNQLILTIPQLLADLQKYVAEYEHFGEKVQEAVADQLKTLTSYLDEHFKTYEETEFTED